MPGEEFHPYEKREQATRKSTKERGESYQKEMLSNQPPSTGRKERSGKKIPGWGGGKKIPTKKEMKKGRGGPCPPRETKLNTKKWK